MSHKADHFVELWAHLDAASQAGVLVGHRYCTVQAALLGGWFLIHLVHEGIGDEDVALAAGDASRVVVVWSLIWFKSVFLITAVAVWVDGWHLVPDENVEKRLSLEGGHSTWHTVPWNDIHPDEVISDLDSTTIFSWSECRGSKWLNTKSGSTSNHPCGKALSGHVFDSEHF